MEFRIIILKIFITSAMLMFLWSCASENPDLVNPPPASKTTDFRLLNLSSANNPLALVLGDVSSTGPAYYGQITAPVKPPPADSLHLSLKMNGSEVWRTKNKFRLIRDTKYVIITLPPPNGQRADKSPDTIIVVETAFGITEYSRNAFITFINLVPDLSSRYSLKLGCPNGSNISQDLFYRFMSSPTEVPTGPVTLSVLKKTGDNSTPVSSSYTATLNQKGEYAILALLNSNGDEELWILDLRYMDASGFSRLQPVSSSKAYIRTINFSTENITVTKINDPFLAGVGPGKISGYQELPACASDTSDIFRVTTSGTDTSYVSDTLEVNNYYSLLVFDSAAKKAHIPILIKPERMKEVQGARAAVRVVNAAYMRNSVTLSMASRYDNSPSGYKSGEIIAQDVEYPTASSTAFISPGNAPLTLFTATQPANLLTTSITNLEPGKSYLIVITNEITGTDTLDKISVIESNLTDADVIFTQPAIFTQIYNSVSGLQYINIGVNDIQSGRIFYNDWIAVVLDENVQSIIINGITFPFIPDKTARGLLIAAGAGGVSNLYNVSRASMGSSNRSYRRRFVNATTEVNKVNFRIETESTDNFADIGKASEPLEVFREGKISINAINADNGQQFFRVTGIDQLLGKNYSLILSGNSGHGFTIYPLQEY